MRAGTPDELQFFPLNKGQAYLYASYTYEQYRHLGIGLLLTVHTLRELKKRGVNEVCNVVRPDNRVSMKIHLRLGFEPQRFLYGYKVLKWKKTFVGSERHIDRFTNWAKQFYGIRKNTS